MKQRFVRQLKNARGFSLTELMVAVGVSTVMMLGSTSILQEQFKGAKEFRQQDEARALTKELNTIIFKNSSTCGQYFTNLKLDDAQLAQAATEDGTVLPIGAGLANMGLQAAGIGQLTVGQNIGNRDYVLQDIRFANAVLLGYDAANNALYTGDVIITASKPGDDNLLRKGRIVKVNIGSPVFAITAGDKIAACTHEQTEISNEVCNEDTGVCVSVYNRDNDGSCVGNAVATGITSTNGDPIPQIRCAESFTAKCPDGQYLTSSTDMNSPECRPYPNNRVEGYLGDPNSWQALDPTQRTPFGKTHNNVALNDGVDNEPPLIAGLNLKDVQFYNNQNPPWPPQLQDNLSQGLNCPEARAESTCQQGLPFYPNPPNEDPRTCIYNEVTTANCGQLFAGGAGGADNDFQFANGSTNCVCGSQEIANGQNCVTCHMEVSRPFAGREVNAAVYRQRTCNNNKLGAPVVIGGPALCAQRFSVQ